MTTTYAEYFAKWQSRAVLWIFVFYLVLIFEGVMRKFAFPELRNLLFFSRIPVALVVYYIVFVKLKSSIRLADQWVLWWGIAFVMASFVLIPLQFLIGEYSSQHIVVAGYGFVMYFLYIPMAVAVGSVLTREGVQILIRWTVILAIPSAVLVLAQFFAGPDSILNLGSSEDEQSQFRGLMAVAGVVRPTGFFTSALGQALFVTSVFVLLLNQYLSTKWRVNSSATRLAAMISVVVMVVASGSRTLIFMIGLALSITALVATIRIIRSQRIHRRAVASIGLMIVLLVGVAVVLPDALLVLLDRWFLAFEYEQDIFLFGPFGRAFYPLYAFIWYIPETPFVGYLIGIAGNAVESLEWVKKPAAAVEWTGYGVWATESGWAAHIVELGLAGGAFFILFRIILFFRLFGRVVRVALRLGDSLPLLLFSFIGPVILFQQVTTHGTVNGYAWFFFGVVIAACRLAGERK